MMQRGECLLCTEERVSRCHLWRRPNPFLYRGEIVSSLHIGESVALPDVEDANSFYSHGERAPALRKGESVLLPSVEEAYSFSPQRRECLLYTEERVPLYHLRRGQTPSLYRGEIISFLHECLLDTKERVPLCHM